MMQLIGFLISAVTILFCQLLPTPKVKHIMLVMLDWGDCQQVERSEDTLSGAWVFRGTRVPVRALFENLETGATIDEFLEWFPGVTLEQVVAVLAMPNRALPKSNRANPPAT